MTADICAALAAPFDPKTVSWRVGPTTQDKTKGMALAYVDARDVMRRLDDVCGPENWQDEYPWSDGKRVVCRIGVRIGGEWVWKTDGAGDTDTEGEKGALSDAFKRAAVKWGIGRYLYDVDSPWVQIQKKGNSYVIPDAELEKLAGLLRRQYGAPNAQAPSGAPPARLPNPIEPPAVSQERAALIEGWWSRDDYGIDPEIIDGGLARWDYWFLAYVEAAPNLDAFLKLREDNKHYYRRWQATAAKPVVESLIKRVNAASAKLERAAA